MILNTSRIAAGIFVGYLALLPFAWVSLGSLGTLTFKPVHLATAMLMSFVVATRSFWRPPPMQSHAGLFATLFFCFWLVEAASSMWADHGAPVAGTIVKNAIYFMTFFSVMVVTRGLVARRMFRDVVLAGAILGTFGYVVYSIILFRIIGEDLLNTYWQAVVSGDEVRLKFWFFHRLFNCDFSGTCITPMDDDDALGAPLRNTLLGALVTYVVLVGMSARGDRGSTLYRTAVIAAFLSSLLVVVSLSRSNTLALAFTLTLGLIAPILFSHGKGVKLAVGVAFGLIVAFVAFSLLMDSTQQSREDTFVTAIASRIADTGTDPRIVMISNALAAITESPIIGHGAGMRVADGTGEELTVHNLFLASWVEQGIPGLLLSVLWYSALLGAVVGTYRRNEQWSEGFSGRWVALLPLVALIRSLVGGGGELTLVDWTGIGIFFGLLAGKAPESQKQFTRHRDLGASAKWGAFKS